MTQLQEQISAYLKDRNDWVPTEELCAAFGVSERQLRGVGGQPGLCSTIAISRKTNGGGFRHILSATTMEWLRFKHSERSHAISDFRRIARLDRERHQAVRLTVAMSFERDSRQGVMSFAM